MGLFKNNQGFCGVFALLVSMAWGLPTLAAPALDGLAERRLEGASSTSRAQAVRQVSAGLPQPNACLTPRIESLSAQGLPMALSRRNPALSERSHRTPAGFVLRYLPDTGNLPSGNSQGLDETLEIVSQRLDATLRLLVDQLGLAAPRPVEFILTDLEEMVSGYRTGATPSHRREPDLIVLDRSLVGGAEAIARAAAHQLAHQIAASQNPAIGGGWGEAFAGWAVLALDDSLADGLGPLIQHRLNHAGDGLFTTDPELAAGNALWLSFLDQSQSGRTVATWLRWVASIPAGSLPDGNSLEIIDEALRLETDQDLAGLLRDFQLWSLLTGERDDDHHFSFAGSLEAPPFSSQANGLPSVSVRSDPAIAPFGSAQVQLNPEFDRGGMRIRFEGAFAGHWDADLIVIHRNGDRRRLRFELADGSRDDRTVPLQDVESVWLLIRNLGGDSLPQTYTVLAHEEPGFPFELLSVEAIGTDHGIDIRWETAAEHQMIGFNLLRRRVGSDTTVIVNPVWIPSLGDATHATAYSFLDRSARSGVEYEYLVEGITRDAMAVRTSFIPVAEDNP